jgi:5-(carboxyamino)imidazole ribonucleotide synthase
VADAHIAADYVDPVALDTLARRCAAATTEFENVPAEALRFLSKHGIVSPSADSVAVAQDRIAEKGFLASVGLAVAPYKPINSSADIDVAGNTLLPGILKRSRLGYDGKGQVRIADLDEARNAFEQLGAQPCVLEKLVPLRMELSVVVARGFDGAVVTWPVAENRHANGILDLSIVPARITEARAEQARQAAISVATALDYRGVLCVEFFVTEDGRLLANEIAPRPHNSGHATIDACVTSQFEQQLRVLCGLPLGATGLHSPAVMVNLLGDLWANGEPDWRHVLQYPRGKLHVYGKAQPRPGRKMGHYTVLAETTEKALEVALSIRAALANDARATQRQSA